MAPKAVSLLTVAWLAWERHDYAAAECYYAEAVPLAEVSEIPGSCLLHLLTRVHKRRSAAITSGAQFMQEALCVAHASGYTASEALLRVQLARLDVFEGNYGIRRIACAECLALARQLGDAWILHGALHVLALAALAQGDLAEARALASECVALPASPVVRTGVLLVVVDIDIEASEYAVARGHLLEALPLLGSSGDVLATARAIEAVAHLESRVGKPELALRLAGAANAARERPDAVASRVWIESLPTLPLFRDLRERWLGPLLKTVSGADASRWWARGGRCRLARPWRWPTPSLDKSEPPAAQAHREHGRAAHAPTARGRGAGGAGLTNRQIGERLVVTEAAAAKHVEHILDKLGSAPVPRSPPGQPRAA